MFGGRFAAHSNRIKYRLDERTSKDKKKELETSHKTCFMIVRLQLTGK